jgi:DNA-binding PadR family transcriptional regulator
MEKLIYQNLNYFLLSFMVDVVTSFLQGLDRPLILWLLEQKPKHGYELMTEIKRLTGRKLKPSTLYPLLYWLEGEGFVVGEWIKKGKRNLRCYTLTNKGRLLLEKLSHLLNKSIRRVLDDLLSEKTKERLAGPDDLSS